MTMPFFVRLIPGINIILLIVLIALVVVQANAELVQYNETADNCSGFVWHNPSDTSYDEAYVYENYTRPDSINISTDQITVVWQLLIGSYVGGVRNFTLPDSCAQQNPLQTRFTTCNFVLQPEVCQLYEGSSSYAHCWTGSEWYEVFHFASGDESSDISGPYSVGGTGFDVRGDVNISCDGDYNTSALRLDWDLGDVYYYFDQYPNNKGGYIWEGGIYWHKSTAAGDDEGGAASFGSVAIAPVNSSFAMWNPQVYPIMSTCFAELWSGQHVEDFPTKLYSCSVLFLKYLLRQPASFVPEGGLNE